MSALDQKWHVTGSIQFQASGTMRYTQLLANKLQVRRVRLRLPPWPASSTLLYPRAHKRHQLPRFDLRIGLRLLRIYPAPPTNDLGPQDAPLKQRSAAQPAPIAFRRQRLTFQSDRTAWVRAAYL